MQIIQIQMKQLGIEGSINVAEVNRAGETDGRSASASSRRPRRATSFTRGRTAVTPAWSPPPHGASPALGDAALGEEELHAPASQSEEKNINVEQEFAVMIKTVRLHAQLCRIYPFQHR